MIRKIKEGIREVGAQSQRFVDLATETERGLVQTARDALRRGGTSLELKASPGGTLPARSFMSPSVRRSGTSTRCRCPRATS